LNNLTGSAGQSTGATSGGDVIAGAGGTGGTTQKDPYASTYQNPNKIYQANLNQDMGQLDTGVTKNIADTQNELTKSSDAYNTGLNTVDSKYNYNGKQDLENIGDAKTFSRLGSLINPETGKAELGGVQSKSQYYNPDTAGTAAASTVGGLTNQLKDQYGTTTGGARLDAQIYRGSGQAGAAINQDINSLGAFQTDKTQRLGAEKANLDAKGQAIADRSNQLKADGSGYQGELLGTAKGQAAADQAKYDANRAAAMSGLSGKLNSGTVSDEIMRAFNEGLGGRAPIKNFNSTHHPDLVRGLQPAVGMDHWGSTLVTNNRTDDGHGGSNIDMTPFLREKILNDVINPNANALNNMDVSKFVNGPQTFNEGAYLDPRYNQLASLLGGNQIANNGKLSTDVTTDEKAFQSAIQAQLNPQLQAAKQAGSDFFNPASSGSGGGGSGFNFIEQLIGLPGNIANSAGDKIAGFFGW